ncbi:hypothetical protein [uncultured Tessaracoccus sp.]|uniref:hypothetical protein n=1 Tax=uncultured Tessaracoccus sp. TaxID=905023 RepID=UPI0025E827E8|nr:hypothetical protein [uncultured Tessaracoccus sp.]
MYKKLTGGLAALALAVGTSFAGAGVANAAPSNMGTALCAIQDGKATVSPCSVTAKERTVNEGTTVQVTVNGAEGAEVSLALFAAEKDGNLTRISETVPVPLTEGNGIGGAQATVDFAVPELGKTRFGGDNYVIALSDLRNVEQLSAEFGSEVRIRSANASLTSHAEPLPSLDEWRFNTSNGIEGHRFTMQVLVDGKWVKFPRIDAKSSATNSDGQSVFYTHTPKIAKGKYEVRLYNLTTGTAGPAVGTLYLGVPQDDTKPGDSKPGKDGGKKDDSKKDSGKKDSGKDDDKQGSGTGSKGGEPGLPDTGV